MSDETRPEGQEEGDAKGQPDGAAREDREDQSEGGEISDYLDSGKPGEAPQQVAKEQNLPDTVEPLQIPTPTEGEVRERQTGGEAASEGAGCIIDKGQEKAESKGQSSQITTRAAVEAALREEAVNEYCRRIAGGESMKTISTDPDMPAMATFLGWCRENPLYSAAYTDALRMRAAVYADECVSLADEADKCTEAYEVQALKLRVETRRWVASRLLPKMYGDHQVVEHTGEVKMNEKQVDDRLAHLIAKLNTQKVGSQG